MNEAERTLGEELPAAASCRRVWADTAARCALVSFLGAVWAIRRKVDVPAALVGDAELVFDVPGFDGICSMYCAIAPGTP
jgi:hypothetical protein